MPKKYEYKHGNNETKVRIILNDEQYSRLEDIAKRHNMSVDQVVERYIKRCIADYTAP